MCQHQPKKCVLLNVNTHRKWCCPSLCQHLKVKRSFETSESARPRSVMISYV